MDHFFYYFVCCFKKKTQRNFIEDLYFVDECKYVRVRTYIDNQTSNYGTGTGTVLP